MFKLPTGKAAHAKYLLCYYAVPIFGGFLAPEQDEVVDLTIKSTLALASGAVFTAAMAEELDMLIKTHHYLYATVFSRDAVLPNFHTSAGFFFGFFLWKHSYWNFCPLRHVVLHVAASVGHFGTVDTTSTWSGERCTGSRRLSRPTTQVWTTRS